MNRRPKHLSHNAAAMPAIDEGSKTMNRPGTQRLTAAAGSLTAGINIDPNTTGLPGITQLRTIVGAVMTVGLILAVLALIVAAIVWGFGANSSNPHLASRGKTGVLVALGTAVLCGAAVTLINFFWDVGQTV